MCDTPALASHSSGIRGVHHQAQFEKHFKMKWQTKKIWQLILHIHMICEYLLHAKTQKFQFMAVQSRIPHQEYLQVLMWKHNIPI